MVSEFHWSAPQSVVQSECESLGRLKHGGLVSRRAPWPVIEVALSQQKGSFRPIDLKVRHDVDLSDTGL